MPPEDGAGSSPAAATKLDEDGPLPEKRHWPMDEDIVITGIAGRYPESNNVDEFWTKLLSGVELISADDRRWPIGKLTYILITD